MEKIDLKDRKILYQLDIDSRQSFRSIGKKIGLSKDVVASRVKRLQEGGIIKNFFTVIDSSKLGYTSFRFYLTFQRTTPEIKKEIIDHFVNNKYTWIVWGIKGKYDLGVTIWIKDIINFYTFWEETLRKFRYYLQDQVFSVYFQLSIYRMSFLLDDYDENDRIKLEITGGGKKVETDDLDYQILKLLATDSRMPTTDIAEKLNSTAITINNRIKKLIKYDVIQGFRIYPDFSKLGVLFYKVDIILIDYKKKEQILNYIKRNPHVLSLGKTAGYADLELDFIVESVAQLHQIMEDLTIKFPNTIKNYDYFYESDLHKMQFIPQE